MAYSNGGRIVTDGLVLSLDAADRNSYPGSGTTWSDLSGNGYNGTLTNGPTFNSANGGSIVFDGTNDYTVTATTTFTANTDFTYEIYCKSDEFKQQTGIFGNKGYWQAGGPGAVIGNISSPQEVYFYITTDTQHYSISTGIVSTYDWKHFVLRRTDNIMEGFVNGIRINTTRTIVGTILDNSDKFWIGSHSGPSAYWKGNISVARVYNRSLSNIEILQNYNAQKSRFNL